VQFQSYTAAEPQSLLVAAQWHNIDNTLLQNSIDCNMSVNKLVAAKPLTEVPQVPNPTAFCMLFVF
jgi:hypothetical protein